MFVYLNWADNPIVTGLPLNHHFYSVMPDNSGSPSQWRSLLPKNPLKKNGFSDDQ